MHHARHLHVWCHAGPFLLFAGERVFIRDPLCQVFSSYCVGSPCTAPLLSLRLLEPSQQFPEIFIVPAPDIKELLEQLIAQNSLSKFPFEVVQALLLVRTVWLEEVGCCCAAGRGDGPVEFRGKSAVQ